MNRLYYLRDPWRLEGPDEQFRFQETKRLIKKRIGTQFRCMLELGCGEGLQTQYLSDLADCVFGVDASPLAIKRARARKIPNAAFYVGDLNTWKTSQQSCDLVLACEILYYLSDLEFAYRRLNSFGRHCLVSYHRGAFERLDPFFASKPVQSETMLPCSVSVPYLIAVNFIMNTGG